MDRQIEHRLNAMRGQISGGKFPGGGVLVSIFSKDRLPGHDGREIAWIVSGQQLHPSGMMGSVPKVNTSQALLAWAVLPDADPTDAKCMRDPFSEQLHDLFLRLLGKHR